MKRIAGLFLLGLGLAAIVLCLKLRFQFNELATHASPTPGSYPLLELFIPQPPPSDAVSPDELVRVVLFRIHAIGAAGMLFAVAGVALVLMRGHKPTDNTETEQVGK